MTDTPPTPTPDLAELRRLAEAAKTMTPWAYHRDGDYWSIWPTGIEAALKEGKQA